MGFVLIHSSEVVYHRLIITWFDKPYNLWYKFSRGKVLEVRNVWFGEIKVWIVMSDIRFGGLTI
jgi:hypothetical protein